MVDTTAPTLVHAQARIGPNWCDAEQVAQIRDPYRDVIVGQMPISMLQDADDALDAAVAASSVMARLPGYERAALLRRAADTLTSRADDIGRAMTRETGKAIRDATTEALRSADTLRLCAEEAIRIEGEHVPMDGSAIGAGKLAMLLRFPVGVVVAITPFNSPVNLAAHKIGPAFAAGNSVVLKPSPKAPLSAHLFAQAIIDSGIPDGALNVLYGDVVASSLVTDPRVDAVSFTGSVPVGKLIRQTAGMKRVTLELGGVGPTFVHNDADLAVAARECARNGLLLAGQSCASVQNVFVSRPVADDFLGLLQAEVARVRFGDPMDPDTEVGTLIDVQAATRVSNAVDQATDGGARLLCGGGHDGAAVQATVLTDVDPGMEVVKEEIFGPVVTVQPYDDIEPVISWINASPFGLQCGLFTDSTRLAMTVFRGLRTGGVIVNGTSRWRSDQMPYGGVKDSGIGREGPRFAIRDMTEERLLVLN